MIYNFVKIPFYNFKKKEREREENKGKRKEKEKKKAFFTYPCVIHSSTSAHGLFSQTSFIVLFFLSGIHTSFVLAVPLLFHILCTYNILH